MRRKRNKSTRNIFIPFNTLYISFLPWIEIHHEDVGDSIELCLYNETNEGANLRINGLKEEVDALMEFLQDEIAESETEFKELGYIRV